MSSAHKTLGKPIRIVDVYSHNVVTEFERIHVVLPRYPIVSMDTEFPGVIFKPTIDYHHQKQTPFEYYEVMKKNVDALKLIQVGLTLSDAQGNLPDFGTHRCIWQFNFSDFDVSKDSYAADSIHLLKNQGIDFDRNRREGIDSKMFARLLLQTRIVYNHVAAAGLFSQGIFYNYSVNWISFHGGYDFAYLIKILIHPEPLPTRLEDFMRLVTQFFGTRVYDIKHMMKYCEGLFGGLEKVGKTLGVDREVGNCHQAGSDSLLTLRTFFKLYAKHFTNQDIHGAYVVAPVRSNYGLNMYPYNCQMYRSQFPVYPNLIN
ncbi:hypothetical protein MKW94_012791 [Papaver nudicaule]|uniref:poly(A)-specific ribonuclease n=1 Tax=Papaver nudicaule TaxID=74823 RepID=A0AA41W1K4_PAPNU|nr:hypothetical protein [Papaver nudicaule]